MSITTVESMIGHFPTPYPDELLYSICARFDARMRYPNKKSLLRDLFGTTNATAVVDLPGHLGKLIRAIPNNNYYSVERLIDEHTLLPYYSRFLTLSTVKRLKRQMRRSGGSAIQARSGVMASRIRPFQWLRYCPMCSDEDCRLFGETYWHRTHQVPGVEVCHLHNVFLNNSAVRIQNAQTRHVFLSAQCNSERPSLRSLDQIDSGHRALLMLSRNAAWLLEHPSREPATATIRERYLRLLADRGLATYSGRVHIQALLTAFGEKYPQSLLSQLSNLSDDFVRATPTWVLDLVRSTQRAKHPLQHLLLMGLLEKGPFDFFCKPINLQPFGEGPYPCLNRAATHFRERRISECRVTFTKDHGRPVGRFQCDCGFTYIRTGPDLGPDSKYRIDRIGEFGEVWKVSLKEMWCDPQVSLRLMARRLGVDPLTVKRQGMRVNLAFPRMAPRSDLMRRPSVRIVSSQTSGTSAKVLAYREKWQSAFSSNPTAGITELRRIVPSTYSWLRRNDFEWLKANVPSVRTRVLVSRRVDWKKRDQQLAEGVRQASFHLRNSQGPPVRVSVARIASTLKSLALIQKHADKLPETARTLATVADTQVSFAIRRILYITRLYEREGDVPKRWQLIRRAGLRPQVLADATVSEAINAAMIAFSNTCSLQFDPHREIA